MTFGEDFALVSGLFAEHFGVQTVSIMQTIASDTNTNEANEPEEVPSAFAADLEADIRQNGGGEMFDGLQVEATISHVVRIPYTAGVTRKMWVQWGTRRLEIESAVDRRSQGNFLYLMCNEDA